MKIATSLIAAVLLVITGMSGALAQDSGFPTTAELNAQREKMRANPELLLRSNCLADPTTCVALGDFLRAKRPQTPQLEADTRNAFQRACKAKQREACTKFGEMLNKLNDSATIQITPEAVAAASAARKADPSLGYEAGCAANEAAACFDLGNHFRNKNGRTPQDGVDEATAYGHACQLNHAEGCYKFGEIKEKGQGLRIPRDLKMALNLYGQSCKLGWSGGCYSAATLLSAQSVPSEQQPRQAQMVEALYKAGCDLKHVYACKAIGAQ